MKRCFSRYRLALFALSIVSSTVIADQVWIGTSANDVVDEDLVIKGDVLLRLGSTRIEAIHKDITITLSNNAIINGHWAGESQLYIVAGEGRTISLVGDHNITFVGSSQITGDDLLIVQSGPGVFEVALAEGRTFAITSSDGSGGVQYYVLMYGGVDAPIDEYCCDEYCSAPFCCPTEEYLSGGLQCDEYCIDEYASPGNGVNETSNFRPVLSFIPLEGRTNASNPDRTVVVGPKSRMGFLSSRRVEIAQDSGYIIFDPSISGLGRMILEVQNCGAFVATGVYTCQRNGDRITLSNINPVLPAGFQAIWSTVNTLGPDVAAGLLVLDENEILSDLLIDPFLNLGARNDIMNFTGTFSGRRFGVILGSNGVLWIQSNSYLDFVGLALNQMPDVAVPGFENVNPTTILKLRNPSALIVDGSNNPSATSASILFGEEAALFFRSGIADDGVIRDQFDVDPFTIDAASRTRGFGNIVFDVEGELVVNGVPLLRRAPGDEVIVSSKIELLSLEVLPTGGSLFVGSGETNFPLRTFNTEDNELLAYNSGAFLINNRMTLYNTALSHTDVNHNVFQNNDLRSEPTYIGGETFILLNSTTRPSIRFINSRLNVNADIALTGVDLVVPNFVDNEGVALANLVDFAFYSNGICVDNGTGRQMILGTRIGSTAADGTSRVNGNAYLDIMEQDEAIAAGFDPLSPDGNQTLDLITASNDATINDLIQSVDSSSIHTIFLGGTSNISIGVNAPTTGFNIDTNPWLRIAGSVFSFQTRGGASTVSRSIITGTNAIFVDLNGKISIEPGFIANMGVMVIVSQNGIVDLPADQVFFSNGAGIATWNIDLNNPQDQIIVPADQALSTYIFNWMLAKKACPGFIPFTCCVDSCVCAPVTEDNIASLPTIEGSIDDLQLQATRIGDPAQFVIDGGVVRQLTFISNGSSAEAPVAIVVLRNDGAIGLDSAATLGLNGITIIADGSGVININSDVVINNTCAFVKGPNFGPCDSLQLYSAVPRQILLKSSGILNLTSFDLPTDLIELLGELRLVVEPGATIITGMGTLSFGDNSQLIFVPSPNAFDFFNAIPFGPQDSTLPITTVDASLPHNPLSSLTNFGAGLDNTDQFRVRLAGQGTIELRDSAQASLPFNAFVGVESIDDATCFIPVTNLTLSLLDGAQFIVGRLNFNEGGVFQVGNVSDQGTDSSVSFTLNLDGPAASFFIGSRGFVGFGVGIERFDGFQLLTNTLITRQGATCPINFVNPNQNIVNTLFNVGSITFNFFEGEFVHDRIFSGDNVNASLLAVSDAPGVTFDLNFLTPDENIDPVAENDSTFNVVGGGNIVLIEVGVGGVQPVVLDQDGKITDRLTVGMMASTDLQPDNVDVADLTGAEFFDYISTQDASNALSTRDNTFGLANAASVGESFKPEDSGVMLGTVSQGVFLRGQAVNIIGVGQEDSKNRKALDTGAVFVDIDPAINEIVTATNVL